MVKIVVAIALESVEDDMSDPDFMLGLLNNALNAQKICTIIVQYHVTVGLSSVIFESQIRLFIKNKT